MNISFNPNTYESLTGIPFPTSGNIIIPNTITDKDGNIYTVTEIEDHAFNTDKYNDITEVYVSDGILRIGIYAFSNKKELVKVVLPQSINCIDSLAFNHCIKLKDIELPDTIEYIGTGAFDSCTNLEFIKIPYGINSIGIRVFAQSGLRKVIIPNSVYLIQECAFSTCHNLTNIIFSNNLIHICSGAFMNCDSLESIEIPQNVDSIAKSAFTNCNKLKSLSFIGAIRLIDELAFAECRNLTSVSLNNLCVIHSRAFMNCINLRIFKYRDIEYTSAKDIRKKFGILIKHMVFTNTPLMQ